MRRIMSRKCRQACNQQFYEIWYSNENYAKNMLYLKNSNLQYIVFKSEPAMKFLQYLVSFGGLLGFWNRLSFLDLKNLILKFFKRIFSNECVKRNISKLLLLYKKIKKFLKIQVSQSKLFFRMPSKSPKVNENQTQTIDLNPQSKSIFCIWNGLRFYSTLTSFVSLSLNSLKFSGVFFNFRE